MLCFQGDITREVRGDELSGGDESGRNKANFNRHKTVALTRARK
jgi:hypothetical protein